MPHFTVSATSRDAVKHYIANQEEHHRVKPFQDEVIEILKNAGIEIDLKYLS
jgi:putative transposase